MSTLPLPTVPTSSLVPPPPALPGGLSLPSGRTTIISTPNVTPGSFPDRGHYTDVAATLHRARAMVTAGADLIDVGGESTRPNSTRISADEEWAHICTIVESLATGGAIASVDTLHASTARKAAHVGAAITNDMSDGRRDPEMNAAVTKLGYVYVVQYYRALPGMPGGHFDYGDDLVGTLIECVGSQIHDATDADMTADKIVVDLGLGFPPTGDQCWQILRELPHFLQGGYPVLVGASRKRFIKALGDDVDTNSADIAAYCAAANAWATRVHDVTAAVAAITRKGTGVG